MEGDGTGLTFGQRLILAEERTRHPARQPPASRPEVVVIERMDFTTNQGFHIEEPGRAMPIEGAGELVNLAVVADSDQFDIYLAIDGREKASGAATDLEPVSAELERIAVYERNDGRFVWTASEYEFRQSVDAVVTPREQITFQLQRAELDLDQPGGAGAERSGRQSHR